MATTIDLHMGPRPCLREARERLRRLCFERFEVRPAGGVLGAEVRGIDLRDDLSSRLVEDLHRALVEYKVLFFRDQHIDSVQQAKVAACFGELEEHPFLPGVHEQPEVINFEKDETVVGVENAWHSDVSWRLIPSLGSLLRAIEVPQSAGDTLWADMELAYEGLPDDLKDAIDGRFAIHDFAHSFGQLLTPEQLEARRKEFPPARHPVVRTHPDTGRRCLYVNRIFTSHIEDMSFDESQALLERLYAQAAVPEYQVRFRWAPGSLAFWDNRSTQHYAVNDYWPERRVMNRVTIIGEIPS